jgi:hypothetical protein
MTARLVKRCLEEGCDELTERSRCPEHWRERYGHRHKQARRRWSRLVACGGVGCNRCCHPIRPGEPWQLDHRPDGSWPAHVECNQRAAANGIA